MNNTVSQILRFIIVLLLQVFICNYINLFGFATPALYLLALFLLPLELPLSVQYLIGFASGLFVDMFTHTLGVNALACVLFMFVRPYFVKALNGRKTSETTDRPIPGIKDFKWLITYVTVLTLLHQALVIGIEVASFKNFGHTLLTIVANTILTAFVILCTEYIFFPVKGKS